MKKKTIALFVLLCSIAASSFAQDGNSAAAAGDRSFAYLAAGLAVGLACVGAGMAVGRIGAATIGAMTENESFSGKALPFIGLAEGICLWGFLVALLCLFM